MRRCLKYIVLFLLLMIAVSIAQEQEVRMDLQVNLFFKILRYDRNIANRGEQGGLKIGVLYNAGNKKSMETWEDFKKEFEQLDEKSLNNIPVFLVPVKGKSELEKAITDYGVNILYIATGFDSQLNNILSTCKAESVLTITGVPRYAEKGVAVGLDIKISKPVIVINTAVAKAVGANFSADILKLAKVIK